MQLRSPGFSIVAQSISHSIMEGGKRTEIIKRRHLHFPVSLRLPIDGVFFAAAVPEGQLPVWVCGHEPLDRPGVLRQTLKPLWSLGIDCRTLFSPRMTGDVREAAWYRVWGVHEAGEEWDHRQRPPAGERQIISIYHRPHASPMDIKAQPAGR